MVGIPGLSFRPFDTLERVKEAIAIARHGKIVIEFTAYVDKERRIMYSSVNERYLICLCRR